VSDLTEASDAERSALSAAGWTIADCRCCWAPPRGLETDEVGYDTEEAMFVLRGEWS